MRTPLLGLLSVLPALGCGESGPALVLVAGALGGPGYADGTGTDARFRPQGVASDGAGNLYVADHDSLAIRKVVLATGEVTTLAGLPGVAGSEDGTGTEARFGGPRGVASDGAGNLFVTDTSYDPATPGGGTIRQVVIATGKVSTLAGSPGLAGSVDGIGADARFGDLQGVATDGAGNLFVADPDNGGIRKVAIATGEVTTLGFYLGASDPGPGFILPGGVATDGAGNLFVADPAFGMIRKVVIATGELTTLAGSLGSDGVDGTGVAAHFGTVWGVTSDGAGNLFVADTSTIRKVVIATGEVTTLAGSPGTYGSADGTGPNARFESGYQAGVATDGAGNLFVAEPANGTIRKVVIATRQVTTLAGSPGASGSLDGTGAAARFKLPIDGGLASDGQGSLLVAEYGGAIRKLVVATGVVTTVAGSTKTNPSVDGTGAAGSASDGAGNLFVPDSVTIRKVVIATGEVTTLAGSWSGGSADGRGAAAGFNGIFGLACDGAENLFVADSGNGTIRKVVIATGEVTTLAGSPGATGSADGRGAAARFGGPHALASDGAGSLFVADWAVDGNGTPTGATIRKVVIATGEVTTLAGSPLAFGYADGAGADARFNNPSALANDIAGNVLVADAGNHAVRKIAVASGLVTTLVGSPDHTGVKLGPLPATLNSPCGLAVAPDGSLFIADEGAILAVR